MRAVLGRSSSVRPRAARRGDTLWIVPGLIALVVLVGVPLGRTGWLALHRTSAAGDSSFAGLDNLREVLSEPSWWNAVGITAIVAVSTVAAQLGIGLAFATALRHATALWPVARLLLVLPAAVLAVVGAIAARSAVEGGYLATWFELADAGPPTRLAAVAASEAWRTTGIVVIVLYLALARVSRSLLDAATADGATPWQRWRRVVLPVIGPVLAALAAWRLLDSWRLFDGPLAVDGPESSATPAAVLVWDTAFGTYETGLAAAAAVVMVLLTIAVAAVALGILRLGRRR